MFIFCLNVYIDSKIVDVFYYYPVKYTTLFHEIFNFLIC